MPCIIGAFTQALPIFYLQMDRLDHYRIPHTGLFQRCVRGLELNQ